LNPKVINARPADPISGQTINQILDKPGITTPPPPDYDGNVSVPLAGFLSVLTTDSPGARLDDKFVNDANDPQNPVIANRNFIVDMTNVAVRFNFRMYLVWRFPASYGKPSVIYTIGTQDWTVFFRAKRTLGNPPTPWQTLATAELPRTLNAFDRNNHASPIVDGPTFNRSYQARLE
jgi:hypothetical protein